MKCKGHFEITKKAVEALAIAYPTHPLLANLRSAGLPVDVVARDILDVLTLGHWLKSGQKHHFMRRSHAQKPIDAYWESVHWIRTNASDTISALGKRIRLFYGDRERHAVLGLTTRKRLGGAAGSLSRYPGARVWAGLERDQPSWSKLGNALHAVQDSFSAAHVTRDPSPSAQWTPGPITDILVYSDAENKATHGKHDKEWRTTDTKQDKPKWDFSEDGRLAVNATKQLILLVIKSSLAEERFLGQWLIDWEIFRNCWLCPSPTLGQRKGYKEDSRYWANV
jgi:hypothetical protein